MARKVIWSHEAAKDLESITEYIASDSPFYAAAFVLEILAAGNSLDRFSERGRIVPELGSAEVRELFVKEYRLIYAVQKDRVVLLGIIHGKRDLKALWEREQRSGEK